MDKKNTFRVNLVKRRKELGLTQEQLAARMNVSPQAVSKWENSSYPDGELLPKLAVVLNISLDDLFGVRIKDSRSDIEKTVNDEIRIADPEKRSEIFMRIMYSALCAYNSNSDAVGRLSEYNDCETYALLRTDNELAISRLNHDMRYFCFLEIPENGVNSYFDDTKNMKRLFRTLADENAIRIISYLGSGVRNKMFSVAQVAHKLEIPEENVQYIVDRLDRFGIAWRVSADISDVPTILYGFSNNVPLAMILVLAKSLTSYIRYSDPNIETWKYGAYRRNDGNDKEIVPQVSWWGQDEK